MNKKVLSLVLALVIVLGTFGTVLAAGETEAQKIQWLVDNGVLAGRTVNADGSADLALDSTITRAEVTKLIVYTLKLENLADILKGVIKAFPDVELTHWANGYISVATTQRADVAYGRRIIIGYPDRKFYPENNVTYGELAAMLVRIVKKDLTAEMEKNSIWATSYIRWAQEEGILAGITVADSNAAVVRRDAFVMIYNAMGKLGTNNSNKVNFGDVMGIVSKAQAGKIQLNQDSKMEYTITFDSRVTDGTTWADVAANSIVPGSLVRLIANEKGEILYLIELGSPREGATTTARWFDVAKKTAETNDFGGKAAVAGDAYFFDEYFKKIYVGGVEAAIDSTTRFFVADVPNNALKEVKTLDEVFKLYIRDYKDLNRVYMGYDDHQGRNEAKVIVFGEVDKYQGGTAIRRVVNYYATNYNITVENTKGQTEVISYANTSYFPRQGYVDKMDVVKLYLNYTNEQSEYGNTVIGGTTFTNYPLGTVKYANESLGGYEVVIDYSEDPVYEISAINLATRYIELKDEYNYVRRFYIKDADVFLEGQAVKGAHVQVEFANDGADVEVVSVVTKGLEGALPNGVRRGMESGWIVRYETLADGRMTITIAMDNIGTEANPVYRNLKTYEVATDWRSAIGELANQFGRNDRVTYDIGDKFGTTPYIYNIEAWAKTDVLPDSGLLPRLNPTNTNGIAEKGQLINGEYNKAQITVPTGDAWNTLPRYSEVTLYAPAAPAGEQLVGFVAEGVEVTLTQDLANRKVTFQMPRTGDVTIKAVYAPIVVTDARVANEGACAIQIVAINGRVLPTAEIITIAPGAVVRDYVNPNAAQAGQPARLTFKTGDKVIVQVAGVTKNDAGVCVSGNCELVAIEVAKTCAAGNPIGVETKVIKGEAPTPCGTAACTEFDCAAEIELACLTELEAIGVQKNASGLRTFNVQKTAGNNLVITPVGASPYYTVELAYTAPETISGTIKLTQAGIDAGVVIRGHQVVEVDGGVLIIDADTANRVNSANVTFRIEGCQEACTGQFQIRVWIDQPCEPCTQPSVNAQ